MNPQTNILTHTNRDYNKLTCNKSSIAILVCICGLGDIQAQTWTSISNGSLTFYFAQGEKLNPGSKGAVIPKNDNPQESDFNFNYKEPGDIKPKINVLGASNYFLNVTDNIISLVEKYSFVDSNKYVTKTTA